MSEDSKKICIALSLDPSLYDRAPTAEERLRHLVEDLKEMVPRCLHDGCSGAKRIRDALRKVGPPYYTEEL